MRSHPDTLSLTPGAAVIAADGETIGHVAASTATHFKVEALRRRDYWLPKATAMDADASAVHLSFDSHQVKDFAVAEPERGTVPTVDEQLEAFDSPEAVEEKRHLMAHPNEATDGEIDTRIARD